MCSILTAVAEKEPKQNFCYFQGKCIAFTQSRNKCGASQSDWWPQVTNSKVIHSWEELDCLPVNSLVMALFCRRAEQMRSSQGGRNSWWLARSSAMVLGEPGEDLCSPSPSWQPSSMESTSRKRDCWGGFTLKRGRRTHLWIKGRKKERHVIQF